MGSVMGYPGVFGVLVLVVIGVWVAAGGTAARAATEPAPRIVGMYVHQHWPYRHPYAARTWTVEDWRGYLDGLRRLGFNTVLVWPMLETMPDPLTPSDERFLRRLATVVDIAHRDFGMRVYLALCPNVGVDDRAAALQTFEDRRFFSCDVRVNPADAQAVRELMDRRERLFRRLSAVDGVSIIDSDPGGYPGSTNQEFVELLGAHRRMLDRVRPGIELVYWMHAGWEAYSRFYQTGRFRLGTEEEQTDCLRRLAALNPEPWGIANGLEHARKLGLENRVIAFNYGVIEGEPSFPLTSFRGDDVYRGARSNAPRGVMGNAQTHCVQLPNTFAFALGATGAPLEQDCYERFADELLLGLGPVIVRAWKALASSNAQEMLAAAEAVDAVRTGPLRPGPLKGLLFGDPKRFLGDLVLQLRFAARLEEFCGAVERNAPAKEPLGRFLEVATAWQKQHGYGNTWWAPRLFDAMRRLNPRVAADVCDRYQPFADVPFERFPGATPWDRIRNGFRALETHTLDMLAALRDIREELP